jgi:hypothetical protein
LSVAVETDIDTRFTEESERVVKGEGLGSGESGELLAFGLGPWAFEGNAATGHDGAALTLMTPTRSELERLFKVGVKGKLEGGEEGPPGGEANAGLGIEEFCEAAAQIGGVREKLRGGWKWDAGPVATQCVPVFLQIFGCVEGRDQM